MYWFTTCVLQYVLSWYTCNMKCKTKRQYLLTCLVSRYCLLALQISTVMCTESVHVYFNVHWVRTYIPENEVSTRVLECVLIQYTSTAICDKSVHVYCNVFWVSTRVLQYVLSQCTCTAMYTKSVRVLQCGQDTYCMQQCHNINNIPAIKSNSIWIQ